MPVPITAPTVTAEYGTVLIMNIAVLQRLDVTDVHPAVVQTPL